MFLKPFTALFYSFCLQGFQFMDPFVPILVDKFSEREAYNMVDYLIERKWIQKPQCKYSFPYSSIEQCVYSYCNFVSSSCICMLFQPFKVCVHMYFECVNFDFISKILNS